MSRTQQLIGSGALCAVNIGLVDVIPVAVEWHEFMHKALMVVVFLIGIGAHGYNSDGTPQTVAFQPPMKAGE